MPPTPKLPAYYVGCHVEGTASEPYFPVRMGHLFAGDGTTWLAILPVMGPAGVASGLPVVRPLHWPNEPPGVGDRDHGDPAAVAAGSGFARGGPAVGHRRKTVRRYLDRARACGLDRRGRLPANR